MVAGDAQTIAGQPPETFAAAHKALRADPTFQFDLKPPPPDPPPPEWFAWVARFFELLGPFLKYLLWGGLIVGLGLILWFVIREFIRYRKPAKVAGAGKALDLEAWKPDAKRARVLLADADKLAAEGLYAEAAHLLLWRSIDEIEERKPRLIAKAYTSRDIASLEQLPGSARQAFRLIAAHVEMNLFGGRPLNASAWGECRSAYEQVAFPDNWTGAA
jgi:hypothetical protein